MKKRAFTLAESVLALALFAAAAVAVSQVCVNCLSALDLPEKSSLDDAVNGQIVAEALKIADYDSLDDGAEVEALDGRKYKIYAKAEPTEVLDLFELSISGKSERREFSTKIFVKRGQSWYENTNERDDLIKDRTDFLEKKRREWRAEK